MSTRTEEVRTVFTWDTADVDNGVKRVERALDRLQQAENKGAQKSDHHKMSNAGWIIKDLAEGRTMFALARMGATLGTIGAIGYVAAGKVRELAEEIKATTNELKGFSEESRKANREASFLTVGSGSSAIGGSIVSARDRMQQGKEKLWDIEGRNDLSSAQSLSDVGRISMYRASKGLGKMLGIDYDPIGKAQQQAGLDQRMSAKTEARSRELYSSSLYSETAQARMSAPGHDNDPFAAKRHELDLAEKVAEAEAKKVGASERDLALVKERYDYLRKSVDAEERLAQRRQNFQSAQITSRFSGASAFSKGLKQSSAQVTESRALLNSDDLTMAQQRSEQLNLQRAEGERREAIMGRYLNPNGTKRRQGAINADFRRDRREGRLRERFIRQYDRGGFDPETGHRRATGDAPGSGLHVGRVQGASGGLQTGGLGGSASQFRELFPPRSQDASGERKNETPEQKAMTEIKDILDKRLPKETK